MTRTAIDLDPDVLRQLRECSQRSGRSMGDIASEAMARALFEEQAPNLSAFAWVDRDLGMPTVDLGNREAVRAILDHP